MLDLLEECRIPLLLSVATWDGNRGLVRGVQQLTTCLKQFGASYQSVFGPLESSDGWAPERAVSERRCAGLSFATVENWIGLAITPNGMDDIVFNELTLKACFGATCRFARRSAIAGGRQCRAE